MGRIREEILCELRENIDEKYRDFHKKLVPGGSVNLGVRMPVVRNIAKKTAKEYGTQYFEDMRGLSAEEKSLLYQEERIIAGLMTGFVKAEKEERAVFLDEWVPLINSWAVCDCGNSNFKFMKKDKEYWFSYVCKYLSSEKEYDRRFAAVTLMQYFMDDDYIDRLLEIYGNMRQGDYYVNMAIAWAISVCFVKFPEKTYIFLADNNLTGDTQNKAIQKIRESLRVSKEDKERVLLYKK